jgi:hypothetical protein
MTEVQWTEVKICSTQNNVFGMMYTLSNVGACKMSSKVMVQLHQALAWLPIAIVAWTDLLHRRVRNHDAMVLVSPLEN